MVTQYPPRDSQGLEATVSLVGCGCARPMLCWVWAYEIVIEIHNQGGCPPVGWPPRVAPPVLLKILLWHRKSRRAGDINRKLPNHGHTSPKFLFSRPHTFSRLSVSFSPSLHRTALHCTPLLSPTTLKYICRYLSVPFNSYRFLVSFSFPSQMPSFSLPFYFTSLQPTPPQAHSHDTTHPLSHTLPNRQHNQNSTPSHFPSPTLPPPPCRHPPPSPPNPPLHNEPPPATPATPPPPSPTFSRAKSQTGDSRSRKPS